MPDLSPFVATACRRKTLQKSKYVGSPCPQTRRNETSIRAGDISFPNGSQCVPEKYMNAYFWNESLEENMKEIRE